MRVALSAIVVVMLACALLAVGACKPAPSSDSQAEPAISLTGISPRTTSNQTSQPLLVFGRGLAAGMKLRLGAPFGRDLALRVDSEGFGAAVLPADLALAPATVEAKIQVTLVDAAGGAVGHPLEIVVTNDTPFVDLFGLALSPDETTACTVSLTSDELLCADLAGTKPVQALKLSDGPVDIQRAVVGGVDVFVIPHRYAPEIALVAATPAADGTRAQRTIPGPLGANAVLVHEGIAYVAEHIHDQLVAVDLESGAVKWAAKVDPNPRALALVKQSPRDSRKRDASKDAPIDQIAVGSLIAGEVQLVALRDGSVSPAIVPRPGVKILGGHTEPYAEQVVGGKGVRALASAYGAVFVASVGPLVGPNDKQMGVSGTGGVGVIDPVALTYPRHLGFNFGVPQAFALDEARGRLYVADIGEGLIHTVDAKALAGGDEKQQRAAWLSHMPLVLPEAFPLFRAREDFGVNAPADLGAEMAIHSAQTQRQRAGVEVHTGPSALALTKDGARLVVLERFTTRLTVLDVSGDAPTAKHSVTLADPLVQQERRLGQVLYFADFGRTGMSCDSCHLEGHTEGVFFTKTGMMRLWRSVTVRGTRDTPPYFNPPGHPTLEDTVSYVGGRNRFQNPKLNDDEIRRLALYTAALTTPPNPHRTADGGLKQTVDVENGRTGRPAVGMRTFLARCAGCHPPPLYALDQDEKTRRKFMKVTTPEALEIRVEQQDLTFKHRTPPSLVAAWDNWPMLLSARAGFEVTPEGNALVVSDRNAVRAVVDKFSKEGHGNASTLSEQARDDLVAFLLSL